MKSKITRHRDGRITLKDEHGRPSMVFPSAKAYDEWAAATDEERINWATMLTRHRKDLALYHVTRKSYLASIQKSGLRPGAHPRNWDCGPSPSSEQHVYLFGSFMMAVEWAARMEYDIGCDVVILEIVGNTVPTERDTNVEADDDWFRTIQAIPADEIGRVIPLTLKLKQALVKATGDDRGIGL
jgi:hypothetical protein